MTVDDDYADDNDDGIQEGCQYQNTSAYFAS